AQVAEAQVVEVQVVEAQVVEAQVVEAQVVEAQVAETQVVEAQVAETPAVVVVKRIKQNHALALQALFGVDLRVSLNMARRGKIGPKIVLISF
ncbi:MAG: hypothetical protein HOH65_01280, partial [Rhodospirillaceae bacterium]|nr:hypothetical protein [Rhodospirillaceae bacterium]